MPGIAVVAAAYSPDHLAILYPGDCLDFLATIPDESVQLVVTSPPYNIGKAYERRAHLDAYINWQARVIKESNCVSSSALAAFVGRSATMSITEASCRSIFFSTPYSQRLALC